MIVCWSVKGGSGTTVVASLLAAELARTSPAGAVIADLGGDVPAALGVDCDEAQPGLRQWLASSPAVPSAGLHRLLVEVMPGLRLLPQGPLAVRPTHASVQAQRLATTFSGQPLVVDAGTVKAESTVAQQICANATTSLVIVRACYLAVKRMTQSSVRADGFVLVEESGRTFDARDIQDVTGIAHMATIKWDSNVARSVDAGRTKSRPPRAVKPLLGLARKLDCSSEIEHAV